MNADGHVCTSSKERIMAGIDDIKRHPAVHTWSYKLAETAWKLAPMSSAYYNISLVALHSDFDRLDLGF
jgi:hypothetical protein